MSECSICECVFLFGLLFGTRPCIVHTGVYETMLTLSPSHTHTHTHTRIHMRSILNKLTIEKFDALGVQLLGVGVTDINILRGLVVLLFDKVSVWECVWWMGERRGRGV